MPVMPYQDLMCWLARYSLSNVGFFEKGTTVGQGVTLASERYAVVALLRTPFSLKGFVECDEFIHFKRP